MSGDDPERDTIHEISKFFRWARRIRALLAGILPLFFAFLALRNIPVGPYLEYTNSQLYIKSALIIYFFCWFFGAGIDFDTQQAVYVVDPNRGRIPKGYFLMT